MDLSTIIAVKDVILDLPASGKPGLIGRLAAHAATRTGLNEAAIRAALIAREDLGSTGIGGRLAIPHAALPGLARPFAMLALLKRPVDYQAVDGQPVDILFLLLTPEGGAGEHLGILSAVARRARAEGMLGRLRGARSPAAARAAFLAEGD